MGLLAPGRAVPLTADPCCPWLPDFINILPPPGPATDGVVPNGVVALLEYKFLWSEPTPIIPPSRLTAPTLTGFTRGSPFGALV